MKQETVFIIILLSLLLVLLITSLFTSISNTNFKIKVSLLIFNIIGIISIIVYLVKYAYQIYGLNELKKIMNDHKKSLKKAEKKMKDIIDNIYGLDKNVLYRLSGEGINLSQKDNDEDSSNNIILGLLMKVRVIDIFCFCPPDKFIPLSPTS